MNTNPTNYTEFWDFYVFEHRQAMTRLLHFTGTTLGIALAIFFVARGQWYFFPVFFVVGYGFAWFAHFVIEKNKPASFRFPVWSFISDFKMMWFMIIGRMSGEVARVSGTIDRRDAAQSI
ncbi:MAG: Mpo1-like protein [Pyrinomonadaceae bacterium]